MAAVTVSGPGVRCIDLGFQGQPEVVASYLVENRGERALVEIGPTSTLPSLLSALQGIGVDPATIGKVLVTHIHLDHAGAAGSFLRAYPSARLYVHEIGAPHLIDPSRLLASATRIYGDRMHALWGEFAPVPAERLAVLDDGDVVRVGDKALHAVYTPGHAFHHLAFHDPEAQAVFTGDVAAVRLPGTDYVRPPTPPPDLDLALWAESLERIRSLAPRLLYLTHFGAFTDVDAHLRQTRDRLFAWERVVRASWETSADRSQAAEELRSYANRELLESTGSQDSIDRYEVATPYGMSADGYIRYFQQQSKS